MRLGLTFSRPYPSQADEGGFLVLQKTYVTVFRITPVSLEQQSRFPFAQSKK